MPDIAPEALTPLARWDTPTVCNGLEIAAPGSRASGFTVGDLVCHDPSLPPIVGFARTATIRAAQPPEAEEATVRATRAAYYEYVAAGPGPTVIVVQDLDREPGVGAFWGEVNTAIHLGLGSLGVVTNGSIRDLDACAPGFQMLAGRVGPSHAHVHVVEFGVPVEVFGMTVNDGDVVHADRHGAVVVPPGAIEALPAAIELLTRRERVILECARADDFDVEKLRRAMSAAAKIR